MAERDSSFTDEERENIAQSAREVARGGEELLWQVIRAKVQLMALAIRNHSNGVVIDGVFYTSAQLMHEVDVMAELTKQAGMILQFEGRDTMSELDRDAQAAGWGSVFDPDSQISKTLRGHGL